MKKYSILEFFGEPLNYGGQEAFIKNVYSCIDKKNFDFTFITPFECENSQLREMIKNNHDNLLICNFKFDSKMRKKYILQIAKKYLKSDYDVIHIHSGSIFTLYNVAKIAKKAGIKTVITHSHATGRSNLKYKIIKFISDMNIGKYVDYYFACSELAGYWKYPKTVINSKKYFIINNGIDLNKYRFDEKNRILYRKKFGFDNEKILIHVGRFSKEKNHLYILDIFNELLKMDNTTKLLLVGGNGDMLDDVKSKINQLGISDNIRLLINRNDVPELINMSDVFILPSLWEGLPFTGIEAQANGIPCIFSDRITKELNITKSYNSLSIDIDPKIWANKIKSLFNVKRFNNKNEIKKAGYDISDVCHFLERIYGGKNE